MTLIQNNYFFLKWLSYKKIIFSSNDFKIWKIYFLKWHHNLKILFPQIALSSNDFFLKWLFPQMTSSSNDSFLKWLFPQTTSSSNDFILKWLYVYMYVFKLLNYYILYKTMNEIIVKEERIYSKIDHRFSMILWKQP